MSQTSVKTNGVWQGYIDYFWTDMKDGTCNVGASFYLRRTDGYKVDNNGWTVWLRFVEWEDWQWPEAESNYSRIGTSFKVVHTIEANIPLDEDGHATVTIRGSSNGVSVEAKITVGSGQTYGKKSNVFVNPHDHVKMGETLLIWMEGGDGYIVHTLSYKIGSMATSEIIESDVAVGYSWTVPDLMEYLTDPKGNELTITCDTYTTQGRLVGTSNVTVDCLPPDATIPAIASDVILGQETTIDLPRNIDGYALTVSYKLAGETNTLISKKKVNSYKWTPALTLAKKFPADWTADGVLVCETWYGNNQVGTIQVRFRFVLTDSETIRPKVNAPSKTIDNSHLPSTFKSLVIQKMTHLKTAVTSMYTDYSELASITFRIGSDYIVEVPTYKSKTNGHDIYIAETTFTRISSNGTLAISATVRDRRGCEATATSSTVTVVPYELPSVVPYEDMVEILCARTNKDGITKRDGTYLLIQAGKQHSDVTVSGVNKNKSKLQWRIRQTEGEWGDWQLLLGEDDGNQIKKLISGAVSNPQASYDIELQCSDTLGGSRTIQFKVRTDSVSFVLFDGENGAAFGKYPEAAGRVEIADNMKFICFGDADFQGTVRFPGSGWVDMELCNGITGVTGLGNHPVGGVRYRVENHNRVYVEIAVKFQVTARTNKMPVAVIPEELKPGSGGQSPACLGRYGFYLGQFQMDFQSGYIYFNGLYPDPLEPSSYPFGVNGMCGEISYFLD